MKKLLLTLLMAATSTNILAMDENREKVDAVEQSKFIFNFDYYDKRNDAFIKRTTQTMDASSWADCMATLTKMATMILKMYQNEPWKISVSTNCRPEDKVSVSLD